MIYPCILDEIGQISADYFDGLLAYTNNLGFKFLNGTASNDDDIIIMYNNVFTGRKLSNGDSEIIKTINDEILLQL